MYVVCPLQAGAATEQQLHVSGVRQGQREERAEDLDEEEAEGAAGGLPETAREPAPAGTQAFLSDDSERTSSLHLHLCCFFCLILHRTLNQDWAPGKTSSRTEQVTAGLQSQLYHISSISFYYCHSYTALSPIFTSFTYSTVPQNVGACQNWWESSSIKRTCTNLLNVSA